MLHFIYELVDPRTNETRYVGITNNPNMRMKQHVEGSDKNESKKKWLEQLLTENLEPKMKILEIVESRTDARVQEKYWIQKYISEGAKLTNIRLTEERKISAKIPKRVETARRTLPKKPGKYDQYYLGLRPIAPKRAKKDIKILEDFIIKYPHLIDFYGKEKIEESFERHHFWWDTVIKHMQEDYERR